MELAAELARRFDARLVLLSAFEDAGGAAASDTRDEEMPRRVLGSVPNTVTHKAGCSVLVVKTT